MKLSIAALLISAVTAFTPSGNKARTSTQLYRQSEALPWKDSPDYLDGSLPGDVGFDPLNCAETKVGKFYFDVKNEYNIPDLIWMREAELAHGRIAQLATLGFIWPGAVGTLPGNDWTGVDAYAEINPFKALSVAPSLAIYQIVTVFILIEFRRVMLIKSQGRNRIPGDIGLGQGQGRWNPFGLNYSPAEYFEKQTQEIKHCRLAMLGALGLILQAQNSGVSVAEQYANIFDVPEWAGKAGYFLPEGI